MNWSSYKNSTSSKWHLTKIDPGDKSIKYISRAVLLFILVVSSYIALQPEYNMAHWTPNQTMRQLGVPYHLILAYEHYLPWVLHFVIGLVLTVLLFFGELYDLINPGKRIARGFFLMVGLILITEWLQSTVGRRVELIDLAMGMAGIGIATAYLVATKTIRN